jgi:protein gp37
VSDRSAIEWTDATWNAVRGCTKVAAGCKHCYAERFAERFRGVPGHPFEQGFDVRLVPEALDLPLGWRKPRRVFVNSMSDLFHEDVPDDFIAAVFGVMAAAPQHTFQILTKRAERLPRWFAWLEQMAERAKAVFNEDPLSWRRAHILRAGALRKGAPVHGVSAGDIEARGWPLPNVWIGVSVEDQAAADERVPRLLETPAAVRWISAEPLLGPVDLSRWLWADLGERGRARLNGLHWLVCGGESGPGARPIHPAWARALRDQCVAAGVPFFFKQWGEWGDFTAADPKPGAIEDRIFTATGEVLGAGGGRGAQARGMVEAGWRERGGAWMCRVGKKRAGRELDGRTWDQMPEVRHG